ncbi:hypothetical protein [Halorubellus salinus]|uniref:hypothetical protein n=1 Tax=Halorubellus salinus TaxID=755309 RepID=UPI001D076C68|nr:hypothetical protein [Halorubellus salinus]
MERRDMLGTMTALGLGAIAGCSSSPTSGGDGGDGDGGESGGGSGGGSGDGAGGSGDESDATTSDENDAELYIAQAVSTLNAVALRLNKVKDDLDSPDEVDLDQETLLGGIEEARGQLDTASETATETQTKQIATLRNLATVLAEMTRVVGILLTVDANALAEDAQAALDAENYDDALSVVRDAKAKATTAQERTTTAEDALEGVNEDRLAAVDGVEYAKVEAAVTQTASLVDTVDALTSGYEATILGAKDLETGRSRSESKEYEAAEESFGEAKAHFETADATFADSAANAPDDVAARIDVAACQSTHLLKAATAFEKSAAAASDGNLADANSHKEDGEAQLQKVDECASN